MKIENPQNTTFLDLLLNTLLIFVTLFVLSFILISVEKKKDDSTRIIGEFLITMEWDSESNSDIDLWVEDPVGGFVSFRRRETNLSILDRDDLGKRSDKIQTPFGIIQVNDNRELVTLKGFTVGEYIVNAHSYLKSDIDPVKVSIKLEKLNPYQLITVKELTFENSGQEKTAFRFTLDKDGKVTDISTLNRSIIEKQNQIQNEEFQP